MVRSPKRAFASGFGARGGYLRTSADRPRHSLRLPLGLVALLACLALDACHGAVPAAETEGDPSIVLRSTSFQDSRFAIPFTCNGANKSPALNWSAPPAATRSLALILYDGDTPRGGFVHWVFFDRPPAALSLAEAIPTSAQLPDGSRQGRNDFGDLGYGGPCPPGHSQHHYIFVLFALDTKLNLAAGATRSEVETAMKGHVLARGTLVETFSR